MAATADVIVADLADEGGRAGVIAQVRALAGGVDILVNNAGFGWYGYGSDMPWSVAQEMIQTNMTALGASDAVGAARHAGPRLRAYRQHQLHCRQSA